MVVGAAHARPVYRGSLAVIEVDPYVLLGVGQDASADELHDAYRKLAKRYHPDLHPGDPAAERSFKEIAAAYELLRDPLERARFDRERAEDRGADADTYRGRPSASASAAPRAGGSGNAGGDPTSPTAAEPSGFYREAMVEDTWMDPETGFEYVLPKGSKGSLIGAVLLVLTVVGFSVVALDGANFWGRGRAHTWVTLIDARTLMYSILGFMLLCGVIVGGIMNWVERRARSNESERP